MTNSGSNQTPATAKPAAEGVKVIRRRRAGAPEEGAGSNPVVVASNPAPISVDSVSNISSAQLEPKVNVAEVSVPVVPELAEKKSSDEEIVLAKSPSPIEESVKQTEFISSSVVEKTIVEAPSSRISDVREEKSTVTVSQKEVPPVQSLSNQSQTQPLRKPQPVGGATIVRRATPEEIEAAKVRSSQANMAGSSSSDPRFFRGGRREDSRGTRVTNFVGGGERGSSSSPSQGRPERFERGQQERGDRPPRPTSAGGGFSASSTFTAMPDAVPGFDESRIWSRKKDTKKKSNFPDSEEELASKRNLLKKGRDEAVNAKRLLAELAVDDETDVDLPVDEAAIARTVYTPSASAKRRDLKRRKDLKKTKITTPRAAYRQIKIDQTITVGELAHQLAIKSSDLIKKLMGQGVMATVNQSLDYDTAALIAGEFGFETLSIAKSVDEFISEITGSKTKDLSSDSRPPIVTVMGHVDHGKTSILDAIRNANVARGEAGGITQHIGAYTVEHNSKKIAFLDTPGHAAFSNMRARGAKVTDIVVLVVAADDGVMPQTVEAISHAKAANVPIIVAVNKIDKPNINIDRVYTELTEHGIQSEEWGGEVQFVKVSALKRTGISELLEAILLQAEVLDLKASYASDAAGTVVEAHLDKGRGPIATVMIQNGTLKIGDFLVAGLCFGKVRTMIDHAGKSVDAAEPSTPVQVIGLNSVPLAGDQVNVVEDERIAKEIISKREQNARLGEIKKSSAQSLDDLLGKIKSESLAEVAVILKADTQGSVEAIVEALQKLSTSKVNCKVIHKAVGGITEGDLNLASATKAVVVGFNVRAPRALEEESDKKGILIKYFSIIYEVVDAVKAIMAGKLPPIVKEVIIGHAQVRTPFSIPKIGLIAGSSVSDGKITRSSLVRLVRDGIVIYSGKIGSLRRFKDDVREVLSGFECGIGIDGYSDVREGDVIEAYVLEETPATLE